jgi:hypothetical protein
MKRAALALALVLLIVVASIAQYDGPVEIVNPDLQVTIQGSSAWWDRPNLHSNRRDPDGVYALAPEMPQENRFAAVRVSASTGRQSLRNVEIGPGTGFMNCLPNEAVRAVVHGVRFSRLAFHPFLFPSGQGPGFHHTDSATGTIEIVLRDAHGTRPLIRQRAFNSDHIDALLSETCVDRDGHWVAVPTREQEGSWKLSVFRR